MLYAQPNAATHAATSTVMAAVLSAVASARTPPPQPITTTPNPVQVSTASYFSSPSPSVLTNSATGTIPFGYPLPSRSPSPAPLSRSSTPLISSVPSRCPTPSILASLLPPRAPTPSCIVPGYNPTPSSASFAYSPLSSRSPSPSPSVAAVPSRAPTPGIRSFSPTVLRSDSVSFGQSDNSKKAAREDNSAVHHTPRSSLSLKIAAMSELAATASSCVKEIVPLSVPASQCSGGVYFIRSPQGHKVAVFKPCDEEPGAPNNTHSQKLRKGFVPGEGALKEVIAYVLDHDGVAGVPPTVLADLPAMQFACSQIMRKGVPLQRGSVQQFINQAHDSWDIGPQVFPEEQAQAIALLDLRLLNADRHGGNILVRFEHKYDDDMGEDSDDDNWWRRHSGQKPTLIPIDHGFCLPGYPEIGKSWFEWSSWPQCRRPLTRRLVEYVATLNGDNDARVARSLGLREACCTTLRIGTLVVKKCVLAGLTLCDIANLVCREKEDDTPSRLEVLCAEAERCVVGRQHCGGGSVRDAQYVALMLAELDRLLTTELRGHCY